MTSLEMLICIGLLATSGFLSSSEVALFSLSRFQQRFLRENFRASYRKVKRLLADPGGLLVTILVCNEIVNISLATIIAGIVSRNWQNETSWTKAIHAELVPSIPDWIFQMVVGIVVTTPIVLFFGEITPKVAGTRANQVIASLNSGTLSALYVILTPVRRLLKGLVSLFLRMFIRGKDSVSQDRDATSPIREEEFMFMVEEGLKEGTVHSSELEMIRNVFELDDTRVSDVYTPLTQVRTLPSTISVNEAIALLRGGPRFTRVPVTGPNKKKVVGVLYSKDLLLSRLVAGSERLEISKLMHKPFVVPLSMKLNALFRRLKENKTHMAIVEDDTAAAIGIVTMNDVLIALFDDLLEEDEATLASPAAPGGKARL